jgi:hypothetical protein
VLAGTFGLTSARAAQRRGVVQTATIRHGTSQPYRAADPIRSTLPSGGYVCRARSLERLPTSKVSGTLMHDPRGRLGLFAVDRLCSLHCSGFAAHRRSRAPDPSEQGFRPGAMRSCTAEAYTQIGASTGPKRQDPPPPRRSGGISGRRPQHGTKTGHDGPHGTDAVAALLAA